VPSYREKEWVSNMTLAPSPSELSPWVFEDANDGKSTITLAKQISAFRECNALRYGVVARLCLSDRSYSQLASFILILQRTQ